MSRVLVNVPQRLAPPRAETCPPVDAEIWIRQIAHALWLIEGRPEGQDKRHWQLAEYAHLCMSRQLSKSEQAREADRLRCLLAHAGSLQTVQSEDLALAALALLPDVEQALEKVSQLYGLLRRMIGEDIVHDGFQILKVWNLELTESQKMEKVAEALNRFGCSLPRVFPGETDDPDHDDCNGVQDMEVLEQGMQAFEAELPQMLGTHPHQWVAYHGVERVAFGATKTELMQVCIRQKIRYEELLIRMIQPDIPPTALTG